MNTLGLGWWKISYEIFRSGFELLYFSTGVFLIIGLYIGFKQLEITNKDIKIRNERMAVEKSLDYLNIFAETLLPKMNKYIQDISDEEPLLLEAWDPEENDYKLDISEFDEEDELDLLRSLIIRQDKGLQDIFNHLEFLSAGIMHGLAKEEVVYDPISGVFCKFIENEIIALCASRAQGAPFENLITLYKKWKRRKENDAIMLHIKEAERNIEIAKMHVAADEELIKPKDHIGS